MAATKSSARATRVMEEDGDDGGGDGRHELGVGERERARL
jgi:hypothetical protein